jgi:hypothetical protein
MKKIDKFNPVDLDLLICDDNYVFDPDIFSSNELRRYP